MVIELINKKMVLVLSVALALTACSQKNNQYKSSTPSINAPKTYKVKSGDTVSKIANRYGLDWRSLSALNNLDSNHTIYAGQTLVLKGAKKQPLKAKSVAQYRPAESKLPKVNTVQASRQGQPTLENNGLPVQAYVGSPNNNAQKPFVGSSALMKFNYPVGRNNAIVRNFATPTQNGLTEGIFFSGRDGDVVMASLDGVVVGVDMGGTVRSYVLVEHENGYKTAYLDLKNISIQTGQAVNKNTPLGQMQSQTASGLALFEFRVARQGRYIDPVSVLR